MAGRSPRHDGRDTGQARRAMNHIAYAWDFSFLWHYRWLVVWGLGVTILYTAGSIVLGLALGLAVGLLRLSRNKLLTLPLVAYVEVFRCTPLLVQII
jgi:polar amino acid transport system permease protein